MRAFRSTPMPVRRRSRLRSVWRKHRMGTLSRLKSVDELLSALGQATDPLDRHFIFERIVRLTFRQRKENHKMRSLCERVGMQHLKEFPQIAERLKWEIGYGVMPPVITFQCMATLMIEWGDYQKAIDIYEMALSYGIKDRGGAIAKNIATLRRLRR